MCACVRWGGVVGTMDEPWCVFIGCYDSSFSNYELLELIYCGHYLPMEEAICVVYKFEMLSSVSNGQGTWDTPSLA